MSNETIDLRTVHPIDGFLYKSFEKIVNNLPAARISLGIFANKSNYLYGVIQDVFTPEKHRGKGYAYVLLKEIIAYAKKERLYKLTLTCKPELIPLYEKAGFKCRSNPEGSKSVSMRLDLK